MSLLVGCSHTEDSQQVTQKSLVGDTNNSAEKNLDVSPLTSNNPSTGPSVSGLQQPPIAEFTPPESNDPVQLLNYLDQTDIETQKIYRSSAGMAEQNLRDQLVTIARYKQQAADRIISLPDAPPEALKRAKQGKLEALSQQVGLNEARAAPSLEAFANELIDSQDPRLRYNALTVKLGFVVDRLTNGELKDPQLLESSVQELVAVPALIDVAAASALRHAYDVLVNYGYDGSAYDVRQLLITGFRANGSTPLTQLAADLESGERFDTLTGLQRRLANKEVVIPLELQTAATTVAKKYPDAGTLHYLNTAALNMEAAGFDAHATAIYDVISGTLANNSDQDVATEAVAVARARRSRQEIIGQTIDIESTDVNGIAIDWTKYRGKYVIIPFWSSNNDPMTMLQLTQQLVDDYPDKLTALGINLDSPDEPVLALLQKSRIRFTSARQSDPSRMGMSDPLAQQAGLASLPFVLLVDPNGKVVDALLDMIGLQKAVKKRMGE